MGVPVTETLGSGLVYEDVLPLRWRVREFDAPGNSGAPDDANREFLRFVSIIEEQVVQSLGDEPEEVAREILRIETKLNLLLDMVAKLLTRQVDLPRALPVRLSARGIEWFCDDAALAQPSCHGGPEALRPGAGIDVEIFLRPDYPRPLALPARIERLSGEAGGMRVAAAFEEFGAPVRDLLEGMIFRRHRQSVAGKRRGGAPEK